MYTICISCKHACVPFHRLHQFEIPTNLVTFCIPSTKQGDDNQH